MSFLLYYIFKDHSSSPCIVIYKVGCYLVVPLKLPKAQYSLPALVLPSTASLGNTQVTPHIIYSNVHTGSALHSTALQQQV